MSEKELASAIDAALAHVDPDRRKFLGLLLAGVAAAPLLNSASLSAEVKPSDHKAEVFPKNATTVKGNTALKNGSSNTIKMTNQNDKMGKPWDKTSGSNTQIKGTNPAIKDGNSNTIKMTNQNDKTGKFWDKTSGSKTYIKGENPGLKIDNSRTIKGENTQIKGANSQMKAQPNAIKGETKSVPH